MKFLWTDTDTHTHNSEISKNKNEKSKLNKNSANQLVPSMRQNKIKTENQIKQKYMLKKKKETIYENICALGTSTSVSRI